MPANIKNIKIGGVETFSIVDFPTKIAAVVFMQGCPWRCPFCYNTALQPINVESEVIWEKFLSFLEKRQGILDAVVFSGGEPLVQEELISAIDDVKKLGYTVGLHTGGFRPALLKKILPQLGWVGFDIKAPFDNEKYNKAIGRTAAISSNNSILQQVLTSLDLIIDSNIDFECRTTCDPRILSIEDILNIASSLKEKGVKNYHLQKYRPVEGDNTEDCECEKFFQNQELLDFLKDNFNKTELRK